MLFPYLVRNNEDPAYRALHEWKDVLDGIPDIITIHDREFNIIYANRAAEEKLGFTLDGNREVKCYMYYHGTDGPPASCPSCRSFKTQKAAVYEIFEPHLKRFLEIRTTPCVDGNKQLVGLIHIVRDVTDQKKAVEEKLQLETELLHTQKLQTVRTLTGGAVHDFNNFLTAIIGYNELLQADLGKGNTDAAFYSDQIMHAARKASDLTKDILSFSRKATINPRLLDISDVVKHAIKLLSILLSKNISLKTALADDSLTVTADSGQIEQILMNLAINARDAMPDGGVLTIKTETVRIDDAFTRDHGYGRPGRYALISISDSGIGMTENIKRQIFEPFFTTKETGKGTGLGLAIVYGIVKQYGGYIKVNSEPNKGTTFEIYLPVTGSCDDDKRRQAASAQASAPATVLVIEKSPEVRGLISDVLTGSGFEVVEATNIENTVEKISEHSADIGIIITDRPLQGRDNRDYYAKIREIKPGIRVLCTNDSAANNSAQNEKYRHCINFISRPFMPAELLRVVGEMANSRVET